MVESKSKVLPSFQSTTDLVEFFETHDFGEYWSELPAADFEVEIEKGTQTVTHRVRRPKQSAKTS